MVNMTLAFKQEIWLLEGVAEPRPANKLTSSFRGDHHGALEIATCWTRRLAPD